MLGGLQCVDSFQETVPTLLDYAESQNSVRHTFRTDVLESTKNPAVTTNGIGHNNPKMMIRSQHPEYAGAAR